MRAGISPARFLFRLQAQSWVEQGIQKVDDEVRDPDQQDVIDEHTDRSRVVAAEDGLDELMAQPRNRKGLLDHERACDEGGRDRANDGQDDDAGVAKDVDPDDLLLVQAFSPGGGRIVPAALLEDRRARVTSDVTCEWNAERKCRHEYLQPLTAGIGVVIEDSSGQVADDRCADQY